MTPNQDPSPSSQPEPKPSPSLRRALGGYLRLRSPYNLCLDAGLLIVVSYVASSARRWLDVQQGRSPTEQFSMWWALNEASHIAVGMLYYVGVGVFVVGCVRIIADRISLTSRGG